MVHMRAIRWLCVVAAALTFILVGLGGYVRATGAGLACPDWPLCFGRVVPELTGGVIQEYFHRVLGSIVGLCTCVLVYLAYRARAEFPRLWKFSLFMLVLVVAQGVMGGLTVLMKLNPFIVTTHLTLGTLFFQLLLWAAFESLSAGEPRPAQEEKVSKFFNRSVILLTTLVFLQTILGGFVATSGASLACEGFPMCSGEFIPADATGAQLTQIVHRLVGITIGVIGLVVFVAALAIPSARSWSGHLFAVLTLIFMQIVLGILNVLMQIPVSLAVMHLVVAQLILLAIGSVVRELNPKLRIAFPFIERTGAELSEETTSDRALRRVA